MKSKNPHIDSLLCGTQFLKKLTHLPFVDEIWLYGSRARRDNNKLSDIDLAIVCPRASENDWLLIDEIIDQADTLHNIDCVRFDSLLNHVLKENILKFKRKLYVKDSGFMARELWHDSFVALCNSLDRLQEALLKPTIEEDELYQDATIQRFEFVIELYWKTFKRLLALEGINITTPKEALKEAYKIGWIHDETAWLEMLNDRNLTPHTYNAELAMKIYQHIQRNFKALLETFILIEKKYFVIV